MARHRTGYGSCKTTGGAVFTNLKGTKIHFPAKGYEKGENEFRGIPIERVVAVAILTGADLVQAIPSGLPLSETFAMFSPPNTPTVPSSWSALKGTFTEFSISARRNSGTLAI